MVDRTRTPSHVVTGHSAAVCTNRASLIRSLRHVRTLVGCPEFCRMALTVMERRRTDRFVIIHPYDVYTEYSVRGSR